MEKVLVAGATGYLGRYVVKALKEQGYYVRVLVRSPEKMKQQGEHLEPAIDQDADEVFKADITDAAALKDCCKGMDYVFTSVGITKPSGKLSFMDVDYQGNLNLLKEAEIAHVKNFMYIHVFRGEKIEGPATEAKQRFVDQLTESAVPYAVIKPTGYYSDMAEYLKMALKGRVYLIGKGSESINPIHGEDLAHYCVNALSRTKVTLEVGGPDAYSHREIAELAFQTAGKKSKITPLPASILKKLVRLIKRISPSYYALGMFFLNVMTTELLAPRYGDQSLESFFKEYVNRVR
ncbi:SDR family oxidoreductase [Halobacillus salinarum]|uniref:SDR family oxidoreductase n=1 Tax=Halobacillus salinarum TaxID=2932257 RepID=A0ABY4EJA4_9BACI|nr:SDR family oxidoreductase [Halobacillus salinarum]UOQ44542.1 SDR family oxidoreductase [Halobacillus salinarum]